MVRLAGQIAWSRFFQQYAFAFLLFGGSLAVAAWSLFVDFRGQFVVSGLTLLVGTSSGLMLSVWLGGMVTWFEVDETTLRFKRPLRSLRVVPLSELIDIPSWDSDSRGVRVRYSGGGSFYVNFRALSGGLDLAKICLEWTERQAGKTAGGLDTVSVMTVLIKQIVAVVILTGLTFFGLLMLAIGIGRPGVQMQNPTVFILLAAVVGCLSLAGWRYLVLGPWLRTMRWFELRDDVVRFASIFSRTVYEQQLENVESVRTIYSDSVNRANAVRVKLAFRDGQIIHLPVGLLTRSASLIDRAKEILERRAVAQLPPPPHKPLTDHPRWPQIEPHLNPHETVYYLGRPDPWRQWDETAAEMVFGALLCLIGGGMLCVFAWTAIANQIWSPLFGAMFGGGFFAIGIRGLCAPSVKANLQAKTTYAVTSRRVLIFNGCLWGRHAAPMASEEAVKSLSIDDVRNYQIEKRGRDVVFGGRWLRGRKGRSYWVHQGFLAPEDPEAAVAAIRRLLAEHPRDAPQAA